MNEKISNGIKGLVILERGEYIYFYVILLTKLCCFAKYCFSCSVDNAWFKPGLHVRPKHKHKHKHKHKDRHKDVYTCDKHKNKVTYASPEA